MVTIKKLFLGKNSNMHLLDLNLKDILEKKTYENINLINNRFNIRLSN